MRRIRSRYRNLRIGPFQELLYWPATKMITIEGPVVPFFILLEDGDNLLLEDGSNFIQE